MLTVSEPKVAGFTPRWSAFPGFSLLFDNPLRAYRTDSGLEHVACDVAADPTLEFYRGVWGAIEKVGLDRLLQTYLFCALPPESYHVTAFDVANQADLTRCKGDCVEPLRDLLAHPIDAARFSHQLLSVASESPLVTERWNLSFRFDMVRVWGRVMTVRLAPFGSEDAATLARLVDARRELHHAYRERFTLGAGPNFGPHLSLGYFANLEGTELAAPRLAAWNEAISAAVADLPLPFETISLHGFHSMAEFFRLPPNPGLAASRPEGS